MKTSRTRSGYILICLLLSVITLILHATYYHPFISDDALISLRYAHRLIDGKGLTWNDGKPVEGYSNLLWILLIAAMGKIGFDLITATRILGVLGMSVIPISLCLSFEKIHTHRGHRFHPIIAPLFATLSAPVAIWAVGGLEQPLVGALIALSIALMFPLAQSDDAPASRLLTVSLILGLLCLTRPDGPIFTAAAVTALVIIRRTGHQNITWKKFLMILSFPIISYIGQLVFRLLYYGEWIPNPALVKIKPSAAHFLSGFFYFLEGNKALFPFSFLAVTILFLLFFSAKYRKHIAFPFSVFLFWSLYVIFIGGDIFPGYRHFIPLIVVYAFTLAFGFFLFQERLAKQSPEYKWIAVVIPIVFAVVFLYLQFTDPQNRRAVAERWEWDGKEVGLILKKAFSDRQPLIAVTAACCIPYWSELPSLDMLGLNDYYIPRHPPKTIGNDWIGHELSNAAYVIRRNPDIIIFESGKRAYLKCGNDLLNTPEFNERYVPVTIQLPENKHKKLLYFNKYSKKIGIKTAKGQITIPGFLFTGIFNTVAHIDSSGQLTAYTSGDDFLDISFESDPIEQWAADVKASNPDAVQVRLTQDGRSVTVELTVKTKTPIEIKEVNIKPGIGGNNVNAPALSDLSLSRCLSGPNE